MRYSGAVPELLANRYELTTKVADGEVAAVWRGAMRTEAGFARPVAIRIVREPWDRDRAVIGAWAAAASELAERASPYVEQVLDVTFAEGRAYVVSEWIEGISLRRWISAHAREGQQVPWPLAAAIAIEVLRALASAHAGTPPLCHEGVSARSVRLARSGTVKLTRFGVAPALAVRGTGRRELEELGLLTAVPELIAGESVRPSADLFAVGALLFEILTAQPPFGAQPGEARDAAVRAGELPDLSAVRADVPPILIAQIERALAVAPEARFESAAAMIRALARILQAEVEPSGPEAVAASVAAVLDRPKPSARPQGLSEQRTMHVDLSELTVLPRSGSTEAEPPEQPEPEEPEAKEEGARPQRYRFGYKERQRAAATRAAEQGLTKEESEALPLPLTKKTDEPETKKPRGLAPQRTEFLDADQVDRLTIEKLAKPAGLAPQKTEFLDADQVERLTIPDGRKTEK